jgi:hypothetical protein
MLQLNQGEKKMSTYYNAVRIEIPFVGEEDYRIMKTSKNSEEYYVSSNTDCCTPLSPIFKSEEECIEWAEVN